jgi:probable rRNA maturation factor
VDEERLRSAVQTVLHGESVESATISIAIVDDATIERLNRGYLKHDGPTDVLSFMLEADGTRLDGEVIVSAETAAKSAVHFGWDTGDELLLYVIHGTLHLLGHDDETSEARSAMRERERHYLSLFGVTPRHDDMSITTSKNEQ